MSEPHLDFSQDHLPTAERHNEHASTDFDWPELFRNCDGELEHLKESLSHADFVRLEAAIISIIAYAIDTRDNMNVGFDRAVGRRLLYLASVLCPRIVGMKRREMTRNFGITKQAVSVGVADARRFLRGLRV